MNKLNLLTITFLIATVLWPSTVSANELSDSVLTITDSSVKSRAYYNRTDIKKIIFPEDLSGIYSFAFSGCTNLKEVVFTGTIPFFKEGAFYGCNSIDRVEIQPGYLEDWCIRSTDYSWDRPHGKGFYIGPVEITELEVPESVTTIGFYAFYGFKNFESVKWPAHAITVCEGGLPFASLKSIYCNSLNNWIESSFQDRPFYSSTNLYINNEPCPSVLDIPDGITRIGMNCFCGNTQITEAVIPASVLDMGYGAFMNCTNLTKLTIKAKSIGYQDRLFSGCTSLEEVILDGCGIISGGEYFMTNCPIQTFRFNNSAFRRDAEVNTGRTKEVYINNLKMWCENKSVLNSQAKLYINEVIPDSLEIPDGVVTISDRAFIGQDYDRVVIPASVKSIGNYSLSDVKSIVCHATIPPEITASTFANVNKSECRIIVPENSCKQYQDAQYWSEFANIVTSDDDVCAIEDHGSAQVVTDIRIYNALGQELMRFSPSSLRPIIPKSLGHGIFYIKIGNETQKVVL